MNQWIIFGTILYLVIILIVSIRNKTKGVREFGYIGKREYSTFGLASSIASSWIGINTILIFGAFLAGFGYWVAIALIIPMIVLALLPYLVSKYFDVFKKHKFTTITDFVKFRSSKKVALFFSLILIVIHIVGIINGYLAGATVLNFISGVPIILGVIFLALFIMTYLMIGGFKAVIATDKIQYIAMIGIVFIAGIGLFLIDWSKVAISSTLFKEVPTSAILFFTVYGFLAILPENAFWQRIFAAKNTTVLKRGFFWGAILSIIPILILTLVGVVGITNAVDPALSIVLFFEAHFGGILGVLSIMFFLAVMMSTMDTIFFSLSTILLNDFIKAKPTVKKERITFLLLTVASVFIAWLSPNILNNAVIGVGIFMALPIPILYLIVAKKVRKIPLWSSIIFGALAIGYCTVTGTVGLIMTPIIVGASLLGLIFGFATKLVK
jgi:solute:Na+ symporter, SSS family